MNRAAFLVIIFLFLSGFATAGPPWGCYLDLGGVNDGVSDYAIVPASSSLNISNNAVSVSLWVNLSALPSGYASSYAGIYDSDDDAYVIYEDGFNNELRMKVSDADGTAERPGIPESHLSTNAWHHVVGIYDGLNARAMIYLDGQLEDTHNNASLTGNVKTGQVSAFGRDGESNRYYFTGAVEDVRVYNTMLSASDVYALFTGDEDTSVGNPAAHWTFDECSGQAVADANTANANDFNLGSSYLADSADANWVSQPKNGPFGGYLDFDGGDYVQLSDVSEFDLVAGQDFSFEAWVKTTTKANNPRIIGKRLNSGDLKGYELYINATDGYIAANLDYSAGNPGAGVASKDITDGIWHHIALTLEGTTAKLFVDGSQDASNTDDGLDNGYVNSVGLRLGGRTVTFAGTANFTGAMDEFRLSNISRDIETDWNAGLYETELIVDANTVALWHFNEGTGQTVTDANAGNHNGTLGADSGSSSDDPTWRGASATLSNAPNGTVFGDAAGNTTSMVTSEATLLVSGVPRVKFRPGTNMDLDGVTFAQNSTKTAIKDLNTVAGIASPSFTLYVPNTQSGGVDVCPHAAALADLNGDCTDAVTWTDGEAGSATAKTVENNSVTVSKITLNGSALYMVDGVTGTGAEEGEGEGEGGVPEYPLELIGLLALVLMAAMYGVERFSGKKE